MDTVIVDGGEQSPETVTEAPTNENDVAIAAIEAQAEVAIVEARVEGEVAVAEVIAEARVEEAKEQDPWPIISQLSGQVETLTAAVQSLLIPQPPTSSVEELTEAETEAALAIVEEAAENLTPLSTLDETRETETEALPESGAGGEVLAEILPPAIRKPIIRLV